MPRYIEESEIESAALQVLESYESKHATVLYYVPIDEIVERHLGIHLEVFDNGLIPNRFYGEVLGYIDFQEKSIGVHESILPENGGSEGRYGFTLAHEVGHFILHQSEIEANAMQLSCFEAEPSRYMGKSADTRSLLEWQADCFASYLMMPRDIVLLYWEDLTGSRKPITYNAIIRTFPDGVRRNFGKEALAQMFIKDMANSLKVSSTALFIRLKRMGMITEQEQLVWEM